jgi:general stress protein YciG
MGGHARAKALGKEGMREIARRGGAATAAKGKEHLAELGRRGQRARAANIRRAALMEVEAQAAHMSSAELLRWLRSEIAKTEKPTGQR